MNDDIEQYTEWYKIEDIEVKSDDAIILNRKEIISLIDKKTSLLQQEIKTLTDQISNLQKEMIQLRTLNEREKNLYVRSRIPFRFTPENNNFSIYKNYDIPFKLFSATKHKEN